MFNKNTLSLALISAVGLTACSDSSGPEGKDPRGYTLTVIDGYVGGAEICADMNFNNVCDAEEVIGKTSASGQFSVAEKYADYPIIARSIAGLSTDSDRLGYVTQSYELTAEPNAKVVTPFSTLAVTKNMSLSELAAELNVDASVIAGDYIQAKSEAGSADSAITSHALARSLVKEMPISLTDLDADALTETALDVKDAIDQQVNVGGVDSVDAIDFVTSVDGGIEQQQVITDLVEYLSDGTSKDWQFISINASYAADEGVQEMTVTPTEMCFESNPGCMPYQVSGNVFTYEEEVDEFVYLSHNIAFVVPLDDGDLTFWTTEDLSSVSDSHDFTADDFQGNTWYSVFDDGDKLEVDPTMIEFRFGEYDEGSQQGDLVFIEDGVAESASYALVDGNLEITVAGQGSWQYRYVMTNGQLMMVNEIDADPRGDNGLLLHIYTQDKALAENIIERWNGTLK